MSAPLDAHVIALTRLGIGQPFSYKKDSKPLRGEGHYKDDLNLPNQVYAMRTAGSRP